MVKEEQYAVRLRGIPLYWNGQGFAYGVYWKPWGECTEVATHYNDLAVNVEIVTRDEWTLEERAKERIRKEYERKKERDERLTLKGYLKHASND